MTELQQVLALETSVEFDGKTYRISKVALEVMAAWEDWLFNETLERTIRAMRTKPNGEMLAIKATAEMSAEGIFDFYEEASLVRMSKISGLKRLMLFRLRQNHPDITNAIVEAIVDRDFEQFQLAIKAEMAAQDALLPNDDAPTGANQSESGGEPSLPKSAMPKTSCQPTTESAA